ncbi:hypothetical protein B0H16DRAFT_1793722, partial [Mycena metata]
SIVSRKWTQNRTKSGKDVHPRNVSNTGFVAHFNMVVISKRVQVALINITRDVLKRMICNNAGHRVIYAVTNRLYQARYELSTDRASVERDYLIASIFGAYPGAACANDPELFGIMAERGCAVFDFAYGETISAPVFDKLSKENGVSLLRVRRSDQCIQQLTDLAKSNTCILALQISGDIGDELQRTVQQNRNHWGANLSNDAFHFCFADGFKAVQYAMELNGNVGTAFILIKTEQPGKWRVDCWHHFSPSRIPGLNYPLSVTLQTQVQGDTAFLGEMEISALPGSPIPKFGQAFATVKLSTEVHQTDLSRMAKFQ